MHEIFFIHFHPIDRYPPAVNLVRHIDATQLYKLHVITTGQSKVEGEWKIHCSNVRSTILPDMRGVGSRWRRAFGYIYFQVSTFLLLCWRRPRTVIYYETLSSLSPALYKLLINRSADLFIHYHEYMSRDDYRNGMALERISHWLEKKVYRRSAWISHTNSKRLELFLADHSLMDIDHCAVMPNYPPASWAKIRDGIPRKGGGKLAFVYVGALSLTTMHTASFARLVASYPDSCFWHIYAATYDQEAIDFLNSLNASNITFHGAVNYDLLPVILPAYDIGLILYKGLSANFKYNAPNKLFEYLACGLNVWSYLKLQVEDLRFSETDKPWVRNVIASEELLPTLQDGMRATHTSLQDYHAENAFRGFMQALLQSTQ